MTQDLPTYALIFVKGTETSKSEWASHSPAFGAIVRIPDVATGEIREFHLSAIVPEADAKTYRSSIHGLLAALQFVADQGHHGAIAIRTDQPGLRAGAHNRLAATWQLTNWTSSQRKPVPNTDLWERFLLLTDGKDIRAPAMARARETNMLRCLGLADAAGRAGVIGLSVTEVQQPMRQIA